MPDLAQPSAGQGQASPGQILVEVDTAAFPGVVERSNQVPVVLVLTAAASQPSLDLADTMKELVAGYGGRLILGQVDLAGNPQIAQALGVQAVPTVLALIKGQPVPLFQGTAEVEQIKAVLDQVLQAASQAGVSGQVSGSGQVEVPVPPLHLAGYEALEQGDLVGARQAFAKALAEAPADATAKAALAQIALLERLDQADSAEDDAGGADGGNLGSAGDAAGADLARTMAAADQAVASGLAGQGFALLLDQLPKANPEDREAIRVRLLELFEVAGADSPEVAGARRRLASALF